MTNPFLSFIIPTLNEEHFLPQLLTDLQRQNQRNFEVIVVDGDSSDKTASIIARFKNDLEISFFTVKKRNVSFQRNFGAAQARGDYFIFLDADSRIDRAFVKYIKQTIKKHKALIFIPLIFPQERSYQDNLIFAISNFIIEISQTLGKPISAGGSLIFHRDCFRFLAGFDEKLFISEDHELIQRARQYGISARIAKNVKVKFSLRRFKQEGRFDLFKKYLIAWAHYFANGGIHKKLFEYNMGGGRYPDVRAKTKSRQSPPLSAEKIKEYFNRLKNQFEQMV